MQIGSAHPQIAGDAENPRGAQSGGGAGDWGLTQPTGRSAWRCLWPALPGCSSLSAGEALRGSLGPDPAPLLAPSSTGGFGPVGTRGQG